MSKQIALFGGSFNPPGLHHLEIAQELINNFDAVLIVPCGPRPDKQSTNEIASEHRRKMIELTFAGLEKIRFEFFDLGNNTFTRTIDLEKRFKQEGEIWHVVGADLVAGGRSGESPIQKSWHEGQYLWDNSRFAIFARLGYTLEPADLPKHSRLFGVVNPASSQEIRELIQAHREFGHLLPETVKTYIQKMKLYLT